MTSSVVIQSFGNIKKATAVSFIRQIILFIPLALIFSQLFGLYGAIYAGPIADFICFIIVIFIFNSEYVKIKNKKEEIAITDNDVAVKKSNSNIIVTINREYGSGGRYVARLLADLLNTNFYDKEIINITAQNTGLSKNYIDENEQRITKQRAVKYYGLNKKNALKKIIEINKQREKHYKYYTNEDWKNLDNYDYTFNVDKLGVEKTAEVIRDIVINLNNKNK